MLRSILPNTVVSMICSTLWVSRRFPGPYLALQDQKFHFSAWNKKIIHEIGNDTEQILNTYDLSLMERGFRWTWFLGNIPERCISLLRCPKYQSSNSLWITTLSPTKRPREYGISVDSKLAMANWKTFNRLIQKDQSFSTTYQQHRKKVY